MQYISTRGQAAPLEFEDVLIEGLARDGGLYVPEAWPAILPDEIASMAGWSYTQVARRIMTPFVSPELAEALPGIIDKAYATFRDSAVAPLKKLSCAAANDSAGGCPEGNSKGDSGESSGTSSEGHFGGSCGMTSGGTSGATSGGGGEGGLYLMELFHGPTLAFKDVAMQVLGGLFEHVLAKRDQRVTIIGATSGDTGSAAIEAFRGRSRASIFILHPHGRTSDVQRKQMTTVDASNVFNLAIDGTFDDCQNLLKAMFNDGPFRDAVNMSGVNSINWARLMPQIVYYFTAALSLHGRDAATKPTRFSVPTGNFGDIYAGYAAAKMGLPIERLVIASNQNDILTRVMNTGKHTLGEVAQTLAPSMDIQISSNFERLLFDMLGRDGGAVIAKMRQLKAEGTFTVSPEALASVGGLFSACRVDEAQMLGTMKRVYQTTGELIDPHTAIGVASAWMEMQQHAADSHQDHGGNAAATSTANSKVNSGGTSGGGDVISRGGGAAMVVLGTAHPAKFPAAVEHAAGVYPPLPEHMADLYEREEKYDVLPNDLAAVQAYVRQRV